MRARLQIRQPLRSEGDHEGPAKRRRTPRARRSPRQLESTHARIGQWPSRFQEIPKTATFSSSARDWPAWPPRSASPGRASRSSPAARPIGSARAGRWPCSAARSISSRVSPSGETIEPLAAPLRSLRIIDDTGALFAPRPIAFHADEIGLEAFGWNVENAAMADALAEAAVERGEPSAPRFAGRALRLRTRGRSAATRRRSALPGEARRRRGRTRLERAQGRRYRSANASLSPERADRASRPCAPARRLYERVSHPTGAVHTRSPAREPKRSMALQSRLGDVPRRGGAARRARRRSARRRDRAPGAFAARRDARRGRARRLPDGASES